MELIMEGKTIRRAEPIAATERSMPPVRSTIVCPKLMMMIKDAARVSVLMLYAVKKLPVAACTAIPTRIVTMRTIPAVDLKKSIIFLPIVLFPPTEMPLSERLLLWSCLHLRYIL